VSVVELGLLVLESWWLNLLILMSTMGDVKIIYPCLKAAAAFYQAHLPLAPACRRKRVPRPPGLEFNNRYFSLSLSLVLSHNAHSATVYDGGQEAHPRLPRQ
jgi:hypothetical protein